MDAKDIVPGKDEFIDLAKLGLKISIGTTAASVVGAYASGIESPIPVISGRTLGSVITTATLYAGYKVVPNKGLKDSLKYGAAGAAIHTAGSLTFDIIDAANIELPGLLNTALAGLTGVGPARQKQLALQ